MWMLLKNIPIPSLILLLNSLNIMLKSGVRLTTRRPKTLYLSVFESINLLDKTHSISYLKELLNLYDY